MPAVTVIIPAYQAAGFLEETVGSVLRQTDADWEILIIDDGSTDGTGDIAEALAQAHPDRIFAFRRKNAGQGAARNFGVKHARGQFLAFLDADDLWEPEKLAIQRKVLEGDGELALVCSDVLSVDESGRNGFAMMQFKKPRSGRVFGDLLQENFISIPTTLVRKSAFLEVGGFSEDREIGVEDYHLWLKIARHHPVAYRAEILAKYRIHGNSFSSRKLPMLQKALAVLDKVVQEDPAIATEYPQDLAKGKARIHFEMGYHLLQSGEFAEARKCMAASFRSAPGHRPAWKEWLILALAPKGLLRWRNRRNGGA